MAKTRSYSAKLASLFTCHLECAIYTWACAMLIFDSSTGYAGMRLLRPVEDRWGIVPGFYWTAELLLVLEFLLITMIYDEAALHYAVGVTAAMGIAILTEWDFDRSTGLAWLLNFALLDTINAACDSSSRGPPSSRSRRSTRGRHSWADPTHEHEHAGRQKTPLGSWNRTRRPVYDEEQGRQSEDGDSGASQTEGPQSESESKSWQSPQSESGAWHSEVPRSEAGAWHSEVPQSESGAWHSSIPKSESGAWHSEAPRSEPGGTESKPEQPRSGQPGSEGSEKRSTHTNAEQEKQTGPWLAMTWNVSFKVASAPWQRQ